MKKVTKKQMFEAILNAEGVQSNPAYVEFIENEIALIERRAANKKPTKTQVENEALKDQIVATLRNINNGTATEILNQGSFDRNRITIQRISALLKQMVDIKTVKRDKNEQGRTIFSLVEGD